MATRKLSRNDPCHCGSGRKYKKCCLATEQFPRQDYAIGHPQPVYGEDGTGARPEAGYYGLPQLKPVVRLGIDYTFDELFGRAEVSYSFPVGQLVILDNGSVLPVKRLEPGMRMRLEDGHVATVTKVAEPKIWEPPSRTPNADGRYARRVLGTIKRIGFAVFDLIAGGQSITTTPGHPFWSVDRRCWVAAGELRVGERLRAGDASAVPVEGRSPLRRELIELYNIEVEEFHTYFVGGGGRGGLLAHNGLEGDCGIPKPASPDSGRGLGNPFRGKTAPEIDGMFRTKGYDPRGPDPAKGLGGYVNPKNGRSYHIDPNNSFGEPPHVDVNRLKTYRGPLDKKKYVY